MVTDLALINACKYVGRGVWTHYSCQNPCAPPQPAITTLSFQLCVPSEQPSLLLVSHLTYDPHQHNSSMTLLPPSSYFLLFPPVKDQASVYTHIVHHPGCLLRPRPLLFSYFLFPPLRVHSDSPWCVTVCAPEASVDSDQTLNSNNAGSWSEAVCCHSVFNSINN